MKLLPMLEIYGRFPLFILSVLFNDAGKLIKLRQKEIFFFALEAFATVSIKTLLFDRWLPVFRRNLLNQSSGYNLTN